MAGIPAAAHALAVPLIAQCEGFRAAPYLCPAGKWTIGFGTTVYPDGKAVKPGDTPIDEAKAKLYLASALSRVDSTLRPLLKRLPTACQYAAMLALAYNIGGGAFTSSTLLAKFNAGDDLGAADQFLAWNKGHVNGKLTVLDGLTKRRAKERALFLGGA